MSQELKLVPVEPTQAMLDAITTERRKGNGALQMWYEAFAAAPTPPKPDHSAHYPSEDELITCGLGYPFSKEEAVQLYYSGFKTEPITILEAWEAIGHDIGCNPSKDELLESLRNMTAICEAHGNDFPAAPQPKPGHSARPLDTVKGDARAMSWVPCSPAWIEAGGDCATAERICCASGQGVSHLHPAHTRPDAVEIAARDKRIAELEAVLKFYADGDHLLLADPDEWDTCSGEPVNWLHDNAGTASVEDGSMAKQALSKGEPNE